MNHKKLVKRWKRHLSERRLWEAGYQECYDFCLPGKQSFFQRSNHEDAPEIFDETAVIGIQEFASRMQAGLVPNFSKWVKLEAGKGIPETERARVNIELDNITDIVFEYVHASNFGQEAHEFLIDVGLGTGAIEVLEGSAIEPLVFNAVPLPELALGSAYNDQLCEFFRARKKRIGDIERDYRVTIPEEIKRKASNMEGNSGREPEDFEITVVVAVYRDWDRDNEYAYTRCVFLPDADEEAGLLKKEDLLGQGSNPFIGARWSKVSGEAWGRGPVYNLMPAIRVVNLVTQLTLENAEMAIAGMMTYEDDGVFNPDNISIRPGELVGIAPGSAGLRGVDNASDFGVGDLILTRLKEDIKKGLYNETLGSTAGTPMSATEVSQRMADLSRQIGSAFGRLQVEFVNAILQRVLYILKKKGIIDIPVVDGREIRIVATNPLAQAQAVEEINGVTNWLGVVAQFYGEQGVNLYTDGAKVAQYTQGKFGVPEELYRDDANRAQMVQNMAAAQQGAQGELPPNVESITGQVA